MKTINWDTNQSLLLKESRGICFEDVVFHIEQGDIVDDYEHPNRQKYAGQRIMVVCIDQYAYLVPSVETHEEVFLKTIIPSRYATKKYVGDDHED